MSLYNFQYTSDAEEQIKLKQHQKSIESALKELSISSRINQEQEHEKLISTLSQQDQQKIHPRTLSFIDFNQYLLNATNTKCSKPYNPLFSYSYDQLSFGAQTPDISRERTPSMISSSSYMSDISSNHEENYTSLNYNLSERDDYGFKRSLWIKPAKVVEFEQKYKKSKDKQFKRWNKLFLNNNHQWPPYCSQLNRYVHKGIPHAIRAKTWMHYSGAQQKMDSCENLYQSLLHKPNTDKNEYIELIHKEKHRLFPDNIYFYNENYQQTKLHALCRVLTAFTYFSSEIGYCRSLGLLAAFLLLVVEDEEQAFWLLVTLVHDYFPEAMFDPVMNGAQIEQTVFMLTVYEQLPGIWSKIANKKCFWECKEKETLPSISLIANHWFLTMFVNSIPTETVLRIWDCVLIGGGFTVVHQVALTLLMLNEKRISNVKDSVEALQILQSMPKQMIDCDEFINCVFSSNNNNITTESMESKRSLFKNRSFQREMNAGHF